MDLFPFHLRLNTQVSLSDRKVTLVRHKYLGRNLKLRFVITQILWKELILEGVEIFEAIPKQKKFMDLFLLPFASKHTSFTFGPETNARAA